MSFAICGIGEIECVSPAGGVKKWTTITRALYLTTGNNILFAQQSALTHTHTHAHRAGAFTWATFALLWAQMPTWQIFSQSFVQTCETQTKKNSCILLSLSLSCVQNQTPIYSLFCKMLYSFLRSLFVRIFTCLCLRVCVSRMFCNMGKLSSRGQFWKGTPIFNDVKNMLI